LQGDIDDEDERGRGRVRLRQAVLHSGEVRDQLWRGALQIVVTLRKRIALEAERAHPQLRGHVHRANEKQKQDEK
jgi:hypothetical protein